VELGVQPRPGTSSSTSTGTSSRRDRMLLGRFLLLCNGGYNQPASCPGQSPALQCNLLGCSPPGNVERPLTVQCPIKSNA
jgi:hypothetical protein